MPVPELDGRDCESATEHLWYDDSGEPVAYLRIMRDPDGSARIGRVCTAATHRGRGYAGRLVAHALARIGPDTACSLAAQSHLAGFYRAYGFEQVRTGIP